MTQPLVTTLGETLLIPLPTQETKGNLVRQLFALALPVLLEQILNMFVGLNDTYLANHLPAHPADAGSAVATIAYLMGILGLIVASVGTGSTALIARAKGARHRSMANRVTGQSVSCVLIGGALFGAVMVAATPLIVKSTQLSGLSQQMADSYFRMLAATLPAMMILFIGGACLRGGGDTLTPAIIMGFVSLFNMLTSFTLTRGWFGFRAEGFDGIARGTVIAYLAGGVIMFVALMIGTPGARLRLHRMRPDWLTIKRLLRIGIPTGIGGLLDWFANMAVITVINRMDPTNAMSNAHMSTARIESISYLVGVAFATAAATMVGMSLGQKNPHRAKQSAYLAYAFGGGFMTLAGILMITVGRFPAVWLSPHDPHIVDLTVQCLRITGFIQCGFAANLVFGFALRGAGDTLVVTALNLMTILGLRFTGVLYVGFIMHGDVTDVWKVLAGELFIRGCITYGRFIQGGWQLLEI